MYLTMLMKSGGLHLDGFVFTLERAIEASWLLWDTAGWIGTFIVLENGIPTAEFWLQSVLCPLDILEWASIAGSNRLMGIIWHIEYMLVDAAIPANCPGASEFCSSFWSGKNMHVVGGVTCVFETTPLLKKMFKQHKRVFRAQWRVYSKQHHCLRKCVNDTSTCWGWSDVCIWNDTTA